MTITNAEASRLFGRLRAALLDLDTILADITEKKAWEALGYETFAEAWKDKLGDVKLSGSLTAAVAYAMYDTGSTPEQVAEAVHGLGPVRTSLLHQAYVKGLNPQQAERFAAKSTSTPPRRVVSQGRVIEASRPVTDEAGNPIPLGKGETYVAAHIRGPAKERGSITLEGFSEDEIATWKAYADRRGVKKYREYLADVLRGEMNRRTGADKV